MSSFRIFDIAGRACPRSPCGSIPWPATWPMPRASVAMPQTAYRARHPVFEAVRAQLRHAAEGHRARHRGARQQHHRRPARAGDALPARQSAGQCRRLCVRAERERGRGDGRHDQRLARLPEQRGDHEHLEGTAARHAAAGSAEHGRRSSHAASPAPDLRRRREEGPARPGAVHAADDRAAAQPGSDQADGSFRDSWASWRSSARFPASRTCRAHCRRCRMRCVPRRCWVARRLVGHDVLADASEGSIGATGDIGGTTTIPEGPPSASLVITDASGQLVRRMPISSQAG